MKEIAKLFLLALIPTPAAAQSDLCWRDHYPWIPGERAGSGSVIEAGNRFQTMTGATVEPWATAYKYQNAIRHQTLSASLVQTTLSDGYGAFAFKMLQRNKEIQPGSFGATMDGTRFTTENRAATVNDAPIKIE